MGSVGIIQIDMHIRDERVFAYLVERIGHCEAQLSHDEIAERFGCHRNTARAIVHRLELAGLIQIDKEAKRGGYIYRRGNCEARNRAG